MFRKKDKPNIEQVTRLQTEIRKGRDAFTRQLTGVSSEGSQPRRDDSEPRTSRLYEVFTAYGAPIGRA
jgi:hypothetical protein